MEQKVALYRRKIKEIRREYNGYYKKLKDDKEYQNEEAIKLFQEFKKAYKQERKMIRCEVNHNSCFDCPYEDCIY